MSVTTLRPNGTPDATGITNVGGAASTYAATSDDSDSTYVRLDNPGSYVVFALENPPSFPAGSLVKWAICRVRLEPTGAPSALVSVQIGTDSGAAYAAAGHQISWTAPTTISSAIAATQFIPALPSTLDDLVITLLEPTNSPIGSQVRIYEVYLDITYVEPPEVTVTGPASPVQTTNLPTITWDTTVDSDGGHANAWEARLFTDAQYGAGGFDPATSTATLESSVLVAGRPATTSWTVPEPLPDDTYRAYVRIAQPVNSTQLWSDWEYVEFTVDVLLPAAPTLVATADDANGRVELDVTGNSGDATTEAIELQRSIDGGATWEPVRLDTDTDGIVTGTSATVYDYEAPNGTEVDYRARALHDYSGEWAASAWAEDAATWFGTDWWLKHPNQQSLNMTVTVRAFEPVERAGRQGVFQPVGATAAIVVSDTRSPASGTVTLRTDTASERDGLDALLDTVGTLLLQAPPSHGEPDRYIRVTGSQRARVSGRATMGYRFDTLTWVEVAKPDGTAE